MKSQNMVTDVRHVTSKGVMLIYTYYTTSLPVMSVYKQ